MVYSFKEGFKVMDEETDETIREAEMQLCLSESGLNSKNQIRELFEFADLNFYHIFRGEDKKESNQQKGDSNKEIDTDNKKELDVNRGWLI